MSLKCWLMNVFLNRTKIYLWCCFSLTNQKVYLGCVCMHGVCVCVCAWCVCAWCVCVRGVCVHTVCVCMVCVYMVCVHGVCVHGVCTWCVCARCVCAWCVCAWFHNPGASAVGNGFSNIFLYMKSTYCDFFTTLFLAVLKKEINLQN